MLHATVEVIWSHIIGRCRGRRTKEKNGNYLDLVDSTEKPIGQNSKHNSGSRGRAGRKIENTTPLNRKQGDRLSPDRTDQGASE